MKNWQFAQNIINWQHQFGRHNLPWQKNNDPYYIWVSEIMLQQTQVKVVIPYFNKFTHVFKNVQSISQSNLNEILYYWSGLGYYHRARNMYKTATIIVGQYDGIFPKNISNLIALPGIGKTTAHAILSFSSDISLPILDGNVKRILIRFYDIKKNNINNTKYEKILWKIINLITPIHHAKIFNQGMMDLGSLICSYKNPKCEICPIKTSCQYDKNVKKTIVNNQKKQHIKKNLFYIILQYKKKILLEYRKKKKIWKKLFCFPECFNLHEIQCWLSKYRINHFQYKKYYHIKHQFSHFTLTMRCIHIIIIKKIVIQKKNNLWYDTINKPLIGIPKPVYNILSTIFNNEY